MDPVIEFSEIKNEVSAFLKKDFIFKIQNNLVNKCKNLNKYKVNICTLATLSSTVFGELNSNNMAKCLIYPRVLGTSVSTSFGSAMQKLCVTHLGAEATPVAGMDIQFNDLVDNKKVIAQMKAGPNTINYDDKEPIITKMRTACKTLVQNRAPEMPIFALVLVYGTEDELNAHYRNIQKENVGAQMNIPIYAGQDFWLRLTGDPTFYSNIINTLIELSEYEDYKKYLEEDIEVLSKEIEERYFTDGLFDITKI